MSNPAPLLQKIHRTLNRDYPLITLRNEGDFELHIPKADDHGFDIVINVGQDEDTLVFGPWHNHFEQTDEGEKELLQILALGLSKQGRLKVTMKGDEPVRAAFETLNSKGQWIWYAEVILARTKFLSRTTILFFQNDSIPVKDLT